MKLLISITLALFIPPIEQSYVEHLQPQIEQLDAFGGEVAGKGWPRKSPASHPRPKPVWPADGKFFNGNLTVPVKQAGRFTLDYKPFRYAGGGDWSSRLKLWQLVDGKATPLETVNDEQSGTLTADVKTAGTLAVAAEASGSAGDFTATSLSPSATWSSGGNSGGFSWSYPLRVPPAPGLSPSVSLSYSSSGVDGRSEATNNQPSVLGEGFEYSPSFIERRYVPCAEDQANGGNNTVKTGDQCWRHDNATMSLNGGGGELIYEAGKGWHSRTENGSRIEKLPGASNGDNDGEHWKVTTTDGTQYFFGLNNLPGQTSATESVFTTPVFGNHVGEPCRVASFAASSCVQAYRWNLDYVVDVRGNTMSYWYEKESNKYARNNTDSDDVTYTRSGVLRRIDYGTYYRTAAEHGVDQSSVTPVGQVVFDYADRCFTNCWSGTDPEKDSWPDSPVDQRCVTDSCQYKYSPTFWTMKRLSKVTTQVGGQPVDSWTFSHSFPPTGDGTHPGLWLDSIVHSGHVGGTVTLPPVTFEAVPMANRVLTVNNTSNNWQRMSNIVTETGAKIHVDYSLPECTASNLPSTPYANTKRCYPVLLEDKSVEWWHKYVVTDVFEMDVPLEGGHQAVTKRTSYEYVGAPAWRYADDDGLSKPDRLTWSQYRGYATVKVRTGDSNQTLQVTNYLRGMHGDRLNLAGGTTSVIVSASLGNETVYDEDAFAGLAREQATYNGVEAKPVSKSVSVPWQSDPTASRGAVSARYTGTSVTYSGTALGVDGARGWRVSRELKQYDQAYGMVDWSQNDGNVAVSGDEKCVSTSYNRNTTKNLLTTVKQTTTTALVCGQSPATGDDIIADVRHYYDGATSPATVPIYGAVTKVDQLKDWSAGTVWQTVSQSTYDKTGRQSSATDVRGNVTTTAYTPAVGGPVTKVETTAGPFGWKSTSEFTPQWGSKRKTIDPNNITTGEAEFDALGRTTKVWTQGWAKSGHESLPSMQFSYNIPANRDTYSSVMTKTLNAAGSYVTAYQILDGLLRARQTQSMALNGDGGRVVTDTIYDDHGRAAVTYVAHAEPGAPSGTLWWDWEWSVSTVTKTEFDRASRPVAEVLYSGDEVANLAEKWRTVSAYEGDLSTKTPPQGGIVSTTVTDVEGRTVERRQPGVTVKYQFNRKGQLAKMIDSAANEWEYTYDIRGRKETEKDPDKGLTRLEYSEANDVIKTTDAREKVLYTVYDTVGRKKELRDDTPTGALRAEWKYDTLYTGQSGFRGQLTQAVRYEPAGSANAYKWQVRQMNQRYQASGVNYVIPAVESGLSGTYLYGYEFSQYTGMQTSLTYPATGDLPAEKITTNFDSATGLAASVDTNWGGTTATMGTSTYNAYGLPVLNVRKMPGGLFVEDSIEYDPATRRIKRTQVKPETSAQSVSDRNYTYDAVGNILSVSDKGDLQCFRYDALARLNQAWTPSTTCATSASVAGMGGPAPYWHEWAFDSAGNRKTETAHGSGGDVVRNYALPVGGSDVVRPHAVTSMTASGATTSYAYDVAGNMTTRGNQTLTWNAENKLATVSIGETNIYDAAGVRLVRRDSGGTTVYLPSQQLRRVGTVNSATRYYPSGGSRTNAGLMWTYSDHQGTQQIAVNAATQAVTIRRQTPYGSPRGTVPAWANAKGFVGGDNDPTGLVNVGARQYDPLLGRFISVDPLLVADDPSQWDGYQYAASNPITKSDPTGTCVFDEDTGRCDVEAHRNQQKQRAKGKGPKPLDHPTGGPAQRECGSPQELLCKMPDKWANGPGVPCPAVGMGYLGCDVSADEMAFNKGSYEYGNDPDTILALLVYAAHLASEGLYVDVHVCMAVCYSLMFAKDGVYRVDLELQNGGISCCSPGAGMSAGWNSASPDQTQTYAYTACGEALVGGCYNQGPRTDGTTYRGGAVTIGTGAGASGGVTEMHKIGSWEQFEVFSLAIALINWYDEK